MRKLLAIGLIGGVIGIGLFLYAASASKESEHKLVNSTATGYHSEQYKADSVVIATIGLTGMALAALGFGIPALLLLPVGAASHSNEVQITGRDNYGRAVKVWIKTDRS
jgi:hypothetical protein